MSLRLRSLSWLLLVVLGLGCVSGCGAAHAREQAITGSAFAEAANVMLDQLGADFTDDLIASIRAAAAQSDADGAVLHLSLQELELRRTTAMRDAKATAMKRWAPIWGEGQATAPTTPATGPGGGLWGNVRAAHEAWSSRLEAGEPVVEEVLDPAVLSSVCRLAVSLPPHTSFHLPKGIVCP